MNKKCTKIKYHLADGGLLMVKWIENLEAGGHRFRSICITFWSTVFLHVL